MRIKNWHKFQHFKDRRPPWVKLYRDLLDDIEWHELDPVAAKALVSLWLIASEHDGELPPTKTLAFRLRMSEKAVETIVSKIGHWLEQSDIAPISDRYQGDPLETETETETQEETETKPNGAHAPMSDPQRALENYNLTAGYLDLSKVNCLTKDRDRKLKARLSEVGLSGWNIALENLADMPFCCGKNERGWKVNFDWLLSPTNLNKVIEKAYARAETPH